jgi:hypothetical protein
MLIHKCFQIFVFKWSKWESVIVPYYREFPKSYMVRQHIVSFLRTPENYQDVTFNQEYDYLCFRFLQGLENPVSL